MKYCGKIWSQWLILIVVVAGIGVIGLLLEKYPLYVAIECLLFALFAMSLDIIVGYAGLVSFGHAAFFGLGAYAAGLSLLHISNSIWIALLVATTIGVAVALFIGSFSIKIRGVYFAIITLAFAEILYRIVNYWGSLTGGSDGLFGFAMPSLNFPGLPEISLGDQRNLFYFSAALLIVSYLVCRKILSSPFGLTLQAIRENDRKVRSMGYNVEGYKVTAFALSAFFATLSGAVFPLLTGFASLDLLYFMMSGQVLIMVMAGGMGTLIGPIIGAFFITILGEASSSYFHQGYLIIIGIILVAVVLFLPAGLASLWRRKVKVSLT